MHHDPHRTVGAVVGLGLAMVVFAFGGGLPQASIPARIHAKEAAIASEFPGATPPLQTRLLGCWESADGGTTLEYAWNGWLTLRGNGSEVKSSYRVDGASHYDVHDEQTRQWLRFKVDFTGTDRMTLTNGAGERTEWRRGS